MGDEETSRLENRPQVSSPVAPMVPVAEEHRRLFGYRPPNNSRASSSTSSRNRKQPAPKCHVVATSTGDRISIPIPNTQTKTFVCLEKKATTAPSTFEKVSMVLAGLEEKSIFFFEGGNSQHVHEKNLRLFQLCKLQEGTKFREQVKGEIVNLWCYPYHLVGILYCTLKQPLPLLRGIKGPFRRTKCLHTFIRTGANAGGCFSFSCQILQ